VAAASSLLVRFSQAVVMAAPETSGRRHPTVLLRDQAAVQVGLLLLERLQSAATMVAAAANDQQAAESAVKAFLSSPTSQQALQQTRPTSS
jgi:hypothetical protein